jgi:sarcosine oxidase
MPPPFDVAIAGLGAMGSACARALARRGLRVAGFDRFAPPHDRGSSHGKSRIIREAYFEHPAYVPLVQHAMRLWDALEEESVRTLRLRTGGLMIGPPEGTLVRGALASARAHDLPHELLDAAAMARRLPVLRPGPDMVGVWEPNAGVLFPEAGIDALLASARRRGATLLLDEPVVSWRADGDAVELRTPRGVHRAGHLVLASGAWLSALAPGLPLSVERVPLFWFEPAADPRGFDPERFPIFILEHARDRFIYGFPRMEGAVKLARHHEGEPADPDRLRRDVEAGEVDAMRDLFRPYLPAADGPLRETAVCMYTNTPDGHFVIGPDARHAAVTLVSACSGHGFKFAPAIGEIVADLVTEGRTRWDLGLFSPGRFAGDAAAEASPNARRP